MKSKHVILKKLLPKWPKPLHVDVLIHIITMHLGFLKYKILEVERNIF